LREKNEEGESQKYLRKNIIEKQKE